MILELPGTQLADPDRRIAMGLFHFSNNNLAVRKRCIEELGGYDPAIRTSEDVDLCFRTALSENWIACREPGMVIRHKARRDLRGLVRQMWGWGINLAGPYRRVRKRGAYLYWVSSSTRAIERALELPRFPIYVCAMPSVFHLMHVAVLLTAALAFSGAQLSLFVCGVWTLWLARRWADTALRAGGHSKQRSLELVALHYLANATFLAACFVGGLRRGMILIPSSIFAPRGKAETA